MEIKIDNNYVNMSLVKSVIKSMSLSKIVNKLNKDPKSKKEHIESMIVFIESLDDTASIKDVRAWDYRTLIECFDKFGVLDDSQYDRLIEGFFFNDYTLARACDITNAVMCQGCKWSAFRAQYGINVKESERNTDNSAFKMLNKIKEICVRHNILNEHNIKFFESSKGLYFLRVYCEMYGTSSWSFSYLRNDISHRTLTSILCAFLEIDLHNDKLEKTYIYSNNDSYTYNTLSRLRLVDEDLYDNHFKIEFERYIYNIMMTYKIKRQNFYSVIDKVQIYAPKEQINVITNSKRIITERALLLPGKQIADIVRLNPELAFIDGLIANKVKKRSFKKEFVTKDLE